MITAVHIATCKFGDACECLSHRLIATAELLRWIAAFTRVCP